MKRKLFTPILLAACISVASVHAADTPKDPRKQTTWGLYVDAKEAADMKQKLGEKMLFIDVRDPIEIMFTGFTDAVDINIPFKTANRDAWHNKKPVYQMQVNPNFEKEIAESLETRGLSKEDPVVLMCRSGGTRGAPASKLLEDKGYKQVYVVTDGFEGGKIKEGDQKNWRLKNGWKNAGLPWSYKLNKDKMYLPQADHAAETASVKDKKAAFMLKVQHASPMPNYMRTVRQNAEALNLTAEQKGKLQEWVDANNEKAQQAVKKIIQLESDIASASMDGASKEFLMTKFGEMIDLRQKLATGKTKCRDNIRSILTTGQWHEVVRLEAEKKQQASIAK